jgi:hypothetical protein
MALTVLFVCVGYILSIGLWAKPLVRNETISLRRRHKEAVVGTEGALRSN